jgi:hypothetical protein
MRSFLEQVNLYSEQENYMLYAPDVQAQNRGFVKLSRKRASHHHQKNDGAHYHADYSYDRGIREQQPLCYPLDPDRHCED